MVQCNTVLESVLPRESNSKETDAALLSILTYPGFSITNEQLIKQTRNTVVQKLLGRYGCRRFLRDGFRTAREDSNRLYYEPWELRMFEGIECEWPMFLAWLVIDASFREDYDGADRYMQMLQDVVVREGICAGETATAYTRQLAIERRSTQPCEGANTGEKPVCRRISEATNLSTTMSLVLMPESYAVPAENIDAELAEPHSQNRVTKGNLPHIWGQSLYILSNIIYEGLLLPGEIDPLGRRLLTEPKPDLSVQVVLVAEDDDMKNYLQELQIEVQTFDEIYNEAGIHIYPAKVLGQLYKQLAHTKNATTSYLISTIKKMATGYLNGTRVTLGTLKNFEETSSVKQLSFVGSCGKLRNHLVSSLNTNFIIILFLLGILSENSLIDNTVFFSIICNDMNYLIKHFIAYPCLLSGRKGINPLVKSTHCSLMKNGSQHPITCIGETHKSPMDCAWY
ncbi:unnamed protein product [Echinostoma caproni]|uniref:Phosphorylase b kinase regulatory subunit n=1 Tax=Echinostoma caproni TaxID=27848 RepID=A0A183AT80_9TREM|nr:unnamed protein product [Echinostoma caproni]